MNKISFFEVDIKSSLKGRRKLKDFLGEIFIEENKSIEQVNIIFCSDEYLLSLNKKHLNHHYYTDTLTFPLSDNPEAIKGEIYISVERVRENSISFGVPYYTELVRVIIHSCLHLCGYMDKPEKEITKMNNKQELYVNRWIVSRGA